MKLLKSLIANKIFVFFFLFFIYDLIVAQIINIKPIYYKTYDTGSYINRMEQDSKGIIYYSTFRNICAFDGMEEIEIYVCQTEGEMISGMTIINDSLYFWDRNRIKCIDLSNYHTSQYYERLEEKTHLKELFEFQGKKYLYKRIVGNCSLILQLGDNILENDTLIKLDKIKELKIDEDKECLSILGDHQFYRYIHNKWETYTLPEIEDSSIYHNFIYNNSHQIWLSCINQGLYLFDLLKQEIVESKVSDDFKKIHFMGKDKNGLIYFLSLLGNSYLKNDNYFHCINHISYDFPKRIFGFFCDRQNNVWLFGRWNKLYQVQNSFFLGIDVLKDKVINQRPLDVYSVKNQIVIAYTDTIFIVDSLYSIKKKYFNRGFIRRIVYDSGDVIGIIYEKSKKYFFVHYDMRNNNYSREIDLNFHSGRLDDFELRDHYLYVINQGALLVFDLQKNKVVKKLHPDYEEQEKKIDFNSRKKWYIIRGENKCVACMGYEFYLLNKDNIEKIDIERNGKTVYFNGACFSGEDEIYYVANDSLFLKKNQEIDNLGFVDIKESLFRRMISDDKGNIWIFDKYVFCYVKEKDIIIQFNGENGLIDLEGDIRIPFDIKRIQRFLGYVFFNYKDYIYLFLGENNILSHIRKNIENPFKPHLISIFVNGKRQEIKSGYHLQSNKRNVELNFVYPDYMNSEKIDLYYRLNKDDEWSMIKNKGRLYLHEIPYGKNIFQMKAVYSNQICFEPGRLELNIEVDEPFWKSSMFYFLLLFFVQLVIGLIYYNYYRNQKKIALVKSEIISNLERIVEDKTKKIRSYSNSLEKLVASKSRALMETELKYQRIVDSTQEIVFTCNERFEIVFLNKEGKKLLEEMNIEKNILTEIISKETLDMLNFELSSKGYIRDFQMKIETNQEVKFFLLTVFSKEEESGVFFEGILHDITEMHRYQELLKQAQKMDHLGILSSGLAHEFNNINQILKGNLSILERKNQNEDIRKYLEKIGQASSSIEKLTAQILSYSKDNKTIIKNINPQNILKDTIDFLNSFKKFQSLIFMERTLEEPDSEIMADPIQVQQILMNLFINSVDSMKLMKTKRPITCGVYSETLKEGFETLLGFIPAGDYIVLYVYDKGCGMSEELQRKVFRPFYTTKENGEGTGLGLALVLFFLKQNNAYLRLRSEEGKGAKFDLFFKKNS